MTTVNAKPVRDTGIQWKMERRAKVSELRVMPQTAASRIQKGDLEELDRTKSIILFDAPLGNPLTPEFKRQHEAPLKWMISVVALRPRFSALVSVH
jgi:hypothetical protein